MPFLRPLFVAWFIILASGACSAFSQPARDEGALAGKQSWSDAFFEAARQGWIESRSDLYECSQLLREQMKQRRFTWREQSQYLAKCRNERNPIVAGRSSTFGNVKIWTAERWNALKAHWRQDRERFSQCSSQLKEISKIKRMSRHNERDFLYQCMNDRP
ncbi:MAG: hypothetical protein HY242_04795 [Afipia sp.]|nr:hypothetical protein [Afipia sp.]